MYIANFIDLYLPTIFPFSIFIYYHFYVQLIYDRNLISSYMLETYVFYLFSNIDLLPVLLNFRRVRMLSIISNTSLF